MNSSRIWLVNVHEMCKFPIVRSHSRYHNKCTIVCLISPGDNSINPMFTFYLFELCMLHWLYIYIYIYLYMFIIHILNLVRDKCIHDLLCVRW